MKDTEIINYNIGKYKIFEVEETSSTNKLASKLPIEEFSDRCVLLTWKQTAGVGQRGNYWESKPNKNISITISLMPSKLYASEQFAISMIIALGCMDFISKYTSHACIKWPNDIYIKDKKIGGILIEHSILGEYIERSLCGIGLNINQSKFVSSAPNPVSLQQLIGKESSLSKVLEELLACIESRYSTYKNYEILRDDFMSHLFRRVGIYNWVDENGEFKASIENINEYGQLILKDDSNKLRTYSFKEVKYIGSPNSFK